MNKLLHIVSQFVLLLSLTACSGISAKTSTLVPTAVPSSTLEPSPINTVTFTPEPTNSETPTSIPTLVGLSIPVPDPRVSNPELFELNNPDAPIPQFAHAMNLAGFELSGEQVAQGIKYNEYKDIEGKVFISAVYQLDLETYEEIELETGEIPLLVFENNSWQEATGRILANKLKRIFGATAHYPIYGDEWGRDMPSFLAKHFNGLILENHLRWNGVEKYEDQSVDEVRISQVKELIDYAQENGMVIYGRTVIYSEEYPLWLKNKALTKEQLLNIVDKRLTNTLSPFPEIEIWELFNETHEIELGWHPDALQGKGISLNELILHVYTKANEINSNALYTMSDSFNHTPGGDNFQRILQRVKYLHDHGITNVGVGKHEHLDGASRPPEEEQIIAANNMYGVPVFDTELDVNMKFVPVDDPNRLAKQTIYFERVLRACLMSENCYGTFIWNPGDNSSWFENPVNEGASVYSLNADATPFYDDLTPKISYYAMLAIFIENPQQ